MFDAVSLVKTYPVRGGIASLFRAGKGREVRAVDGVSFSVRAGEVLGIAGESGCGKSTLARMLVGLEKPSAGNVMLDVEDGWSLRERDRRGFHRRVQMVFQDPFASLNPSHDVFRCVAAPLVYQGLASGMELKRRVDETMAMVGLDPPHLYLGKHPHLLSGGQRQRLCIARALILDPQVLVADEPVSMLDVSIKWDIIRLLRRLVRERSIALVYITHDLATVPSICDRLAVMYLGRIVETGPARDLLLSPRHPYTRALVAAVPGLYGTDRRPAPPIASDPRTMPEQATGCSFLPRCPAALPRCAQAVPALDERGGRLVACHAAADA